MNKLLKTPFPRPKFLQYFIVALCTAASVSFILVVFQPFGTSSFKHDHKTLILLGYGFCVLVTLSIYYFLSLNIIHKNRQSNWNIVYEGIDLLLVLLLSLLICYLYSVAVLGRNLDFGQMLYFLGNAFCVAILPVIICIFYLYSRWKGVERSEIVTTDTSKSIDYFKLAGNNLRGPLNIPKSDIIYIQAQDNYVMMHLAGDDKPQRHILRSTLKKIYQELTQEQFIQVHRSYIVNKSRIKNILGNKSKAKLQLDGIDNKVPVSRSLYDKVKMSTTN